MLLKDLIQNLEKISSQHPECLDKEIYVEGDCLPSELLKVKFSKDDNMLHLIVYEKLWPWMIEHLPESDRNFRNLLEQLSIKSRYEDED